MNVFLSYSSSEDVLAERLAYRLRDEDYSVFFDRTSLVPGEGYDSRIRSAIDRSNLFIFLISRESISPGSYALTELGIAQHKWASPSGRILPVMVSEVDLDTLPPYLNAVTVLRPQGDLVAEVMAVVSRLRQRRRVRVYGALVLFFSVLVSGSLLFRWANERFTRPCGGGCGRSRSPQTARRGRSPSCRSCPGHCAPGPRSSDARRTPLDHGEDGR